MVMASYLKLKLCVVLGKLLAFICTYFCFLEQVYNGIPDWVYEEEVLGTNKAMYFSKG